MQKRRLAIGILSAIALALAACGKKGPLYLPQKDTKPQPTAPAK